MNLTIVLPTYNESQNLRPMVHALLDLPLRERLRILVVDDNSPDGTGRIADELAREFPEHVQVLHRARKEGIGPAYIAGFTRALADGADLVLQMDCDFSHRPQDIPKMLEAAADADLVIGSRFCRGGAVDPAWPASRRILSRFANGAYVRAALGLPIHDATGGFRLWRRRALLGIDPARRVTLSGYAFQVELAYLAHALGCRIREVPISFLDRSRGESKMSMRIAAEAAFQVPLLRWRHRRRAGSESSAAVGRGNARPIASRSVRVPRAILVFALLLVLALALRTAAMGSVPLLSEEAYYWMYAQHPSMSYFDHPPMVAWVIRAGTALFGNTEFGVRIVGSLLMCAASVLLYLYGRMWYSRPAALVGAAALVVLPVYFGTGFIATMDASLLFFWIACMLGIGLALKRGHPGGWYLAGAAMGAAMLSKYTGVFLGFGGVLAVLGCRRYRRHLLTVHPYLAVLIALAMITPVIIWNAQHDWASLRFQFIDRFAGKRLNLEDPLQFIGIQFGVATPVLLIGMVWLWVRLLRRPWRLMTPRWWLAICFSAPLLAAAAYKSLRYDIHINWTLPAYVSLMPAVTQLMFVSARRARLKRGTRGKRDALRGIEWTAAICLFINIGAAAFLLIGPAGLVKIAEIGPWRELASIVEAHEEAFETESGREPLIIADGKYALASLLAFYRTPMEYTAPAARYTTSQWLVEGEGLGFEYWLRSDDWLGEDCLLVDVDDHMLQRARDRFERVEFIDDPRLASLGFQAARCYAYRGPHARRAHQ